MPVFRVHMVDRCVRRATVTIEAADEDEARDNAHEMDEDEFEWNEELTEYGVEGINEVGAEGEEEVAE